MAKSNPLSVLGVTADAIRGRPLHEAERHVQVMGRALMQSYHPDRSDGGDSLLFNQVTEAVADLKKPGALKKHVDALLAPLQTKIGIAEAAEKRARREATKARRNLREYFEAISGVLEDPTVFDLQGNTITIFDRVRSEQSGGPARFRAGGEKTLLFPTLRHDDAGALIIERCGKTSTVSRRLIGCIPGATEKARTDVTNLLKNTQVAADMRALPAPMGHRGGFYPKQSLISNRILWMRAGQLLALMTPVIEVDAFLFSTISSEEGLALYFEGVVTRLNSAGA